VRAVPILAVVLLVTGCGERTAVESASAGSTEPPGPEGYAQGLAEGHETGYAVGRQEGFDEGYAEGLEEGREEGRTTALECVREHELTAAEAADVCE
jgi:flagellar assembly protein FliH